jgi:hypothetical protein
MATGDGNGRRNMDEKDKLTDYAKIYNFCFSPSEVTHFARSANALDRAGATGVYFIPNPVNPDLLPRCTSGSGDPHG